MRTIQCSPVQGRTLSRTIDPFGFDSFFDHFFGRTVGGESSPSAAWNPRMDLIEEADRLVARLEVPGVDPKNIEVTLEGTVLTVRGERALVAKEEKGNYLKREHQYGSFERSVRLPVEVNRDEVEAVCENGVMVIRLPKAREYLGRRIQVQAVNSQGGNLANTG